MSFWKSVANQWRDSANFVLGLWLFVSPWVLAFGEFNVAVWNAWILGVIIAVAALAALAQYHEWEEWVSLVFGAWLIVSPWVLGFTAATAALWNHVIVGLLVAGMAAWSIYRFRQHPPAQTV